MFRARIQAKGYTLIEILVVISLIGLISALLLPAFQSAREKARRQHCSHNIAQVSKAVQSYIAMHGFFPPGVIRWVGYDLNLECNPCNRVEFSLFVRILPQLEQSNLFDSFNFDNSIDEPPNDSQLNSSPLFEVMANSTASSTQLAILLCPSDSTSQPTRSAGTNLRTNEGSLPSHISLESFRFSGPATPVYAFSVRRVGQRIIHANSTYLSSAVQTVTDGLSNTVMLSEKLRGTENRHGDPLAFPFDSRRHYAIPWKGLVGDYPESNDDAIRICTNPTTRFIGFNTNTGLVWAIGSIRNGSYNHVAPPNPHYSDCITESGIEPTGIASARSQHNGGVNAGMADGSVRFVRNGISLSVWRAIATKAGGEAISADEY